MQLTFEKYECKNGATPSSDLALLRENKHKQVHGWLSALWFSRCPSLVQVTADKLHLRTAALTCHFFDFSCHGVISATAAWARTCVGEQNTALNGTLWRKGKRKPYESILGSVLDYINDLWQLQYQNNSDFYALFSENTGFRDSSAETHKPHCDRAWLFLHTAETTLLINHLQLFKNQIFRESYLAK